MARHKQQATLQTLQGMDLKRFAASGQFVLVQSKLFGEIIILASDTCMVPDEYLPDLTTRQPGTQPVIYWTRELPVLRRMTPEARQQAHEIKRLFGGVLGDAE